MLIFNNDDNDVDVDDTLNIVNGAFIDDDENVSIIESSSPNT
jgi:hypothetical protein